MSLLNPTSLRASLAIAFLSTSSLLHPVFAGTEGSFMNSAGFGVAVDSVANTYTDPGTGELVTVKSTARTTNMQNPCAAVNAKNFECVGGAFAGLPFRTSTLVYCQSKGFPNYQWAVQAYVTGGATADNPELEERLNILPEDCAEISIETRWLPDNSLIRVTGFATAGAALGLRGYEYPEGLTPPEDKDDLKEFGELKFEILLPGPFSFSEGENCTALNIPVINPDPERFYFVVDTVALSQPFVVTCPDPGTVYYYPCDQPVVYPLPQVTGGCGQITVAYDPPAEKLPPGQTLVTVTATDEAGNKDECNFLAVRGEISFSGFQSPISGTGGTCSAPLRTLNRGSNLPVKFTTDICGSRYLGGTPPYLRVYRCSDFTTPIDQGSFQVVANVWHFNWDTTSVPLGVYRIVAYLQDGTTREAYVRLR
jgi:hypothetical protein